MSISEEDFVEAFLIGWNLASRKKSNLTQGMTDSGARSIQRSWNESDTRRLARGKWLERSQS